MGDMGRLAVVEYRRDEGREGSNRLLALMIVVSIIAHGIIIHYAEINKTRPRPPLELTLRLLPAPAVQRKSPSKPAPSASPARSVPLLPPKRIVHNILPPVPSVPRPVVRQMPAPPPPEIRQKAAPREPITPVPSVPAAKSLPHHVARPKIQEPDVMVREDAADNPPAVSARPRDRGPELRDYLGLIRQRIERHKKYPLIARRRRLEGLVGIHFTISATGDLRDIGVSRTSGHRILDRAAIRAVRAASPLPLPPAGLFAANQVMELNIVFELRRHHQ